MINSSRSNFLVCTKEAARFLGLHPNTLVKWRIGGDGPQYVRIGSRTIRYDIRILERWLERRRYDHTAQYGVDSDQPDADSENKYPPSAPK